MNNNYTEDQFLEEMFLALDTMSMDDWYKLLDLKWKQVLKKELEY